MSDMSATVSKTQGGFHVEGYEKITYDFSFTEDVFGVENHGLASLYKPWGRVLAVMDKNVYSLYGKKMESYFEHYKLHLTVFQTAIGEKAKTIPTFLEIVDAMTTFGIIRKEPVLVVGGGLVTDVAGFACAAYRRNTNFIRIPTTLIGLIDASVSIKVAVNYGNYKNRLGAYHAPTHTFLDFNFLRTLPVAQIRNGFAELIKISACASLKVFDLLDKFCEELIETGFGRQPGSKQEVRNAADVINYEAIRVMLELETPNLHEIGLDRVIAFGHTWSPLHELIPDPALRHGHAISIDMAYSTTLACAQGRISEEQHHRILQLFSRAGLSIDHDSFDSVVLEKATTAILKTRDGQLRAAVPSPIGSCVFINDISKDEMDTALAKHKNFVQNFPRKGYGVDAYVDASDTGYTDNGCDCAGAQEVSLNITTNGMPVKSSKEVTNTVNGIKTNGINGVNNSSNDIEDHIPVFNSMNGKGAEVKYLGQVNGESDYNNTAGDNLQPTKTAVVAGMQ